MNNREEKIAEVMEEFNFERVHLAMESLKWTWGESEESPSIYKIIKTAEKYLNNAADKVEIFGEYEIQFGGFRAESFYSEEEGFAFRLSFILTEWDTFS
tara:strand:+ start:15041 stop:15337 length:297 start_codon:yes stop_codon:yes gene_type:complete